MAAPPSPGTDVQLYFREQNGPKEKVTMHPDDTLQKLIDHARSTWSIADDLHLCLYNTRRNTQANRLPLVDLEQTFQASGLGRCVLIVDYSEESQQLAIERKVKETAAAYQRNFAEHEKWRQTANPVEVFRYDLKRHAQTLEHTMKHADEKQLHRLFNTHGILSIHNMLIGAFQVDPATETQAVNQQAFDNFGRCPDGSAFCSSATRNKVSNHLEASVFVGDIPKFVAPVAQGGGSISSAPRSPPPVVGGRAAAGGNERSPPPPPAAAGGGMPPPQVFATTPPPPPETAVFELTTESLFGGIGEIIRPRRNRKPIMLPKVEKRKVIAAFTNVDLKYGTTEDFGCDCEIYIDEVDGEEAPQLRCKTQTKEKSFDLRWRKKQALSHPAVPGSTAFSMLLELDNCDLHARFCSDADVLNFERAVNHVHRHFHAFVPGAGHRFDEFDFTEKQMIMCGHSNVFCRLLLRPFSSFLKSILSQVSMHVGVL
jgi:hypothetical protein